MRDLSIRTKMTLWFIIILLILLVAIVTIFAVAGETTAREIAREDLREVMEENMDDVRYEKGNKKPLDEGEADPHIIPWGKGYIKVDDDFIDAISGVASGLYDAEGKLIYGKNLIPEETRKLKFSDEKIRRVKSKENTFYVLDLLVRTEENEQIWLRGMIDRGQDREQMYSMYRQFAFVLPFLLLIAGVGGYLIAWRALSPIKKIAEEVSHIARESDLRQRLDIDRGGHEINVIVFAINSMLARLEDSYERRKKFTANVSHDLRTPLAVMTVQTELALEQELSDEQREAFENLQKQTRRMSLILDHLLGYLRFETLSEDYEMSYVNLSQIVENACISFRYMEKDQITLEEEIEKEIYIKGNETLLYSLMDNLISNAFRYGREGGWVKVSLNRIGKGARIRVADNGIGIAEEEQEKIFQWLYQSDPMRTRGGSGFGLYIVKSIAELHGGRVDLESTLSEGSTFTIELPGGSDDPEEKDGTA